MSWLLAFAGFAALIILHEFGHFTAAKAVGMRVEKFSLFFGPMIAKVQRGETTYGIGAIPLGGYVKITGMNPREELAPEVARRGYFAQPVWKRLVVISAGPAMNFLIAFLLIAGIYAIRGTDQGTQRVGTLDAKSPAAHVLRPGDRLVAVDGHRGGPTTFRRLIGAHKCAGTPTDGCLATTTARLTIVRDGVTKTVLVRPRYYANEKATRVGFAYQFRTIHYSLPAAARESVSTMWTVTSKTVTAVVRIFFSSKERKQVSGVVGSYETTRQSFQLSTAQALFVLAIISLSLAVVNLFPFLPLDGGHIFWALAEKVRGRAIPFSVMERASVVGLALVFFIFVVGFTNDINRLTGEGFGVR